MRFRNNLKNNTIQRKLDSKNTFFFSTSLLTSLNARKRAVLKSDELPQYDSDEFTACSSVEAWVSAIQASCCAPSRACWRAVKQCSSDSCRGS